MVRTKPHHNRPSVDHASLPPPLSDEEVAKRRKSRRKARIKARARLRQVNLKRAGRAT